MSYYYFKIVALLPICVNLKSRKIGSILKNWWDARQAASRQLLSLRDSLGTCYWRTWTEQPMSTAVYTSQNV